jgi:hypothetical protein
MKTRMFVPLFAFVLVVGCASQRTNQAAGNGGPTPDGRFQMTTTSISPDMGLTWGDGQLSFNDLDYKFSVEALTLNEWDNSLARSGQQVTLYGNVYKLKNVADFPGTYKEATPEVTSAVGGSDRSRVYQSDKGVIVRVTGRFVPGSMGMSDFFDIRLLHDNFKVTLRAF